MRLVVTGASGNVGSHLLELASGHELIGVARRVPEAGPLADAAEWVACDLAHPSSVDRLFEVVRGADVVIHLAWLIQPGHDEPAMRAVNVDGTEHLLAALRRVAAMDGAPPALIVASSVGAYSAGPKDRAVLESWPTGGIETSTYSRHKVAVERLLDAYETSVPAARVARMRPGVILSAEAASSQARYFLGPFLPMTLVRSSYVPLIPAPSSLIVPIVHSADAAAAFLAAAEHPLAAGAYNVAADEPLTPQLLGSVMNARVVETPRQLLRGLVDISYRLRLQPTDAGWLDMALAAPLMSTRRAKDDLEWRPPLHGHGDPSGLAGRHARPLRGTDTGTPSVTGCAAAAARGIADRDAELGQAGLTHRPHPPSGLRFFSAAPGKAP